MYQFRKQLDGSAWEGLNCNCAVCRSQIQFATGGKADPSVHEVRLRTLNKDGTFDRTGGTRLDQMAAVAATYGVILEVHYGVEFARAWDWLHDETLALNFSILYEPLHGTRHDACPGFDGNHAVGGHDGSIGDPLADARRAGIPLGMAVWEKALLREVTGALNISNDTRRYKALGAGRCYVAVAHAPKAKPKPSKPKPSQPAPAPKPAPAPTAIMRYGGQPRARGAYRIKGDGVALVRSSPNNTARKVGSVPPGIIVTRLLGGRPLPWRVAQTTYTGASVGGSRRWHGDATGKNWVHASLLEVIK